MNNNLVRVKKQSRWVVLLYLFLILQTTNFFLWLSIPPGTFNTFLKIEAIFLVIYLFVKRGFVKRIVSKAMSGRYILYFCLCLFISALPCYLYHGQSFTDSIKAILPFLLILFYFIFYKYDISEKQLLKLFVAIAICKFAILLFQQFTYPIFWFNAYKEGDISNYGVSYKVEIRSGIYRFLLGVFYIFYIVGLYLTYQYLTSHGNKAKYIVLFIMIVIGIYMEQFRYNMACFLLCWLWMNYQKNKAKISYVHIFLICALLYLLYSNFDFLFGDLKDRTDKDLSDDYIRVLCYSFFLQEYWSGLPTILFGNGCPWGTSSYGQEIVYYEENYTFFRADIGLVGAVNVYGLIYLCILFLFIYQIIKNWKYIYFPYRAFYLWLLLMIPLYMPIHYSPDSNIFLAGFLYLTDKSIEHNKESKNKVCKLPNNS